MICYNHPSLCLFCFARVPSPLLQPLLRLLSAQSTQRTGAWRLASSSPPHSPSPGQSTLKPRRKLWGWVNIAELSSAPCHTVYRWSFSNISKSIFAVFSLLLTLWFPFPPNNRIPSPAQSFAVPSSRVWPTGSTPPCHGSPCSPGSMLRGALLGRATPGHMTPHCSRVSWVNGEAEGIHYGHLLNSNWINSFLSISVGCQD